MSGIIGVDLNMKSGVIGGYPLKPSTKLGVTSRAFNGGAGDVSYTGVGFKPRLVYFFASRQDGTSRSWGWDDGVNPLCGMSQYVTHATGTPGTNTSNMSIYCHYDTSNGQKAEIKTMDPDGFTLTWAHIGSPSIGTMIIMWVAIR